MSRNYYSEINLHIVWHTKENMDLLTPAIEPVAHRCLKRRIIATTGVFLHEIGGTDNHIHFAATIPPTLTISDWIGELKGGSSYDVNHQMGQRDKVLQWQAGYGVVSFGTNNLPWVTAYIRNQRQHHQFGSAVERLERIAEDRP